MLAALFNQVLLIEQRRTRTDKTHVTAEDTEKLRQLIQTGLAQEGSTRSQEFLGIGKQMRGYRRRIDSHGTEFRHAENAVMTTDPIRPVDDGAARTAFDKQAHQRDRQGQDQRSN